MVKKIVIGVIVLIVIIIVIGAASGGKSSTTQKVGTNATARTNTQNSNSQSANTVYKVGDQVKSGDFVFSVNSVRKDEGSGYVKPSSGNVYLIPNVTIQNNGKDKTSISSLLQMYVKDGDGNKYTPTMTQDATGKVDGELLAGDKVKGDVGFEVPTTANNLKFYYEPQWLGGASTIVVDLGM